MFDIKKLVVYTDDEMTSGLLYDIKTECENLATTIIANESLIEDIGTSKDFELGDKIYKDCEYIIQQLKVANWSLQQMSDKGKIKSVPDGMISPYFL